MVSGSKTYGRLDREMAQKTKYLFMPPSQTAQWILPAVILVFLLQNNVT
jgi:hypothetical protein